MKRSFIFLFVFVLFFTFSLFSQEMKDIPYSNLIDEAQKTINKIIANDRNWPFPDRDGKKFFVNNGQLPVNGKLDYKQYSILTNQMKKDLGNGKKNTKGLLYIVYESNNSKFYYTDDNFNSFRIVTYLPKNGSAAKKRSSDTEKKSNGVSSNSNPEKKSNGTGTSDTEKKPPKKKSKRSK
jgi:guanyl-specific ribonuclease Sa